VAKEDTGYNKAMIAESQKVWSSLSIACQARTDRHRSRRGYFKVAKDIIMRRRMEGDDAVCYHY
jgi:hypothetical protein